MSPACASNRTRNHERARRASLGPSPDALMPSSALRTGGTWTPTARTPSPSVVATAVGGTPELLGDGRYTAVDGDVYDLGET